MRNKVRNKVLKKFLATTDKIRFVRYCTAIIQETMEQEKQNMLNMLYKAKYRKYDIDKIETGYWKAQVVLDRILHVILNDIKEKTGQIGHDDEIEEEVMVSLEQKIANEIKKQYKNKEET